jgi:hypothetical protein
LALALGGLWLCAGCQEERTLVSERHVIEGMDPPSDGGRTVAGEAHPAHRQEPPKYREHWWQFWRKPMPEEVRMKKEALMKRRLEGAG